MQKEGIEGKKKDNLLKKGIIYTNDFYCRKVITIQRYDFKFQQFNR